jgi:hypothetical protein
VKVPQTIKKKDYRDQITEKVARISLTRIFNASDHVGVPGIDSRIMIKMIINRA